MTVYVPGTAETDNKKKNRSLQAAGAAIANNTTDIAALQTPNYGLVNGSGSLGVSLSKFTASLGADVALNNTANYFDGPSIAQGSTGTWMVMGGVTLVDTGGAAFFDCKLWDGTTVIDSKEWNSIGANGTGTISLSGFLASPAGNLRISVKDKTLTTGKIVFNATGNSKDSTITAIRIA